ncbi:unnamed protein product [Urochloa humidicola]
MADCYRTSVRDEIHRLLPREIFEDIGIVDNPAEHQALDVVDVLAAHLASVLGGAPRKTSYHHHQHPQANLGHSRLGGGGMMDAVAGKVIRAPSVAVPPFLPSPPAAVPWHVMEGLRRNTMALLHPAATMPGFATPTRPPPLLAGGARPTTTVCRRGVGTGVFLPRRATEVVRRTAKAPARSSSPPSNNGDYARMVQQRAQEQAAMVIMRSQHEMRAVAAHMERMCYLGVVRPHLELALPQEWTY